MTGNFRTLPASWARDDVPPDPYRVMKAELDASTTTEPTNPDQTRWSRWHDQRARVLAADGHRCTATDSNGERCTATATDVVRDTLRSVCHGHHPGVSS